MTELEKNDTSSLDIDFKYILTIYVLFYSIALIIQNSRKWLFGYTGSYIKWMYDINVLITENGITNIWTPYPQGMQIISYLLYVISSGFSNILTLIFGDFRGFYALPVFGLLFNIFILIIPNILIFILIYLIGQEFNKKLGTYLCLAYAFFWTPFYNIVLTEYVYDPLPVLFTVLSIYLLMKDKLKYSAIFLGLGVVTKLFPVILFPVFFKYIKNSKDKAIFSVVFSVILIIFFIPFMITNFEFFLSPYFWQSGRPPWQSMYTFFAWLTQMPFNYSQAYYWGNTQTSWIAVGITPKLETLTLAIPKQPGIWWNIVSVIGILISMVPVFIKKIKSKNELLDWSLYSIIVFMFWNIGWSPQYILFILPLVLFLFLRNPINGILVAFGLQLSVGLAYPVLLPFAMKGELVFIIWYWLAELVRYLIFIFIILVVLNRYYKFISADIS